MPTPTRKGVRPGPDFATRGYLRCVVCGLVVRPRFPPNTPPTPAPHQHRTKGGVCAGRFSPGIPVEGR